MAGRKRPGYWLITSYYYSYPFAVQAYSEQQAKQKAYMGLIYPKIQHPSPANARGIYKPEFWRTTTVVRISLQQAAQLIPPLGTKLARAHPVD